MFSVCGIAGLYSPSGAPNPELVDTMAPPSRTAGPMRDRRTRSAAASSGIGGSRVLDLATGFQPVANETDDVVVRLQRRALQLPRLREELRGHRSAAPATRPSCRTVRGERPGLRRRLDGMFAFALWDRPRERLVLARDRLGKKPLVWTRLADGTLAFASELKALLRLPGVRRDVDLGRARRIPRAPVRAWRATGISGIHRLPPGSHAPGRGRSLALERYWTPAAAALSPRSDEEWLERVRATVRDAVRERLVADVPLGALLSGGIDSSVVVSLMAQAAAAAGRGRSPSGSPTRGYDERRYARAVADRYWTVHEELRSSPTSPDAVERLADAFDEPLGDEAAFPTFLICEQARRQVTVALTGTAATSRSRATSATPRTGSPTACRRPSPRPGCAAAPGDPRGPQRTAVDALPRGTLPRHRHGAARRALGAADGGVPARAARASSGRRAGAAAPLDLRPRMPGVAGLQLLDLETYLPGDLLPKADLASMAHSLELRAPLLDRRVVELGLALPDSLKTRGAQGRSRSGARSPPTCRRASRAAERPGSASRSTVVSRGPA